MKEEKITRSCVRARRRLRPARGRVCPCCSCHPAQACVCSRSTCSPSVLCVCSPQAPPCAGVFVCPPQAMCPPQVPPRPGVFSPASGGPTQFGVRVCAVSAPQANSCVVESVSYMLKEQSSQKKKKEPIVLVKIKLAMKLSSPITL